MIWQNLEVSACATHHVSPNGTPAYSERFDEVLKFHAPGRAPVMRHGAAWHICPDGTAAYDRRFARTFGYYEGFAAVIAPDGWHHILPDGRDAYANRHAWCGNFQSGRCTVRTHDGSYGHILPDGRALHAARWRYAGDYRDGYAVVQGDDGRSTHIDAMGRLVHDRWFVDLDVFHKGFARARDEDGWMHVDRQGLPIYARRFHAVEPFYNGQARVERFDGGLEIIDEHGDTRCELRPARRSEFASLSGDLVGFWRTATIGAAARLGVFDVLPATSAAVAASCGLDADGTNRLLRALGELHLTTRNDEQWFLTARGALLHTDHPLTLADAALEYAGPFTTLWSQLPDALRAHSTWSPPDIFGDVATDATRTARHHRMLQSYARHDYPTVCRALGLRGTEHVIDAGGGLGVLAQFLLETFPATTITVLERPEVVALAPRDSQIRWQACDLFAPWPVQADVIVLSRVLHDWNDENALQLLHRARAALLPGGRLHLVEMLLDETGVAGSLCDLHLLMATGGRERSASQFDTLLGAAGFRLDAIRRLPALPTILTAVAS